MYLKISATFIAGLGVGALLTVIAFAVPIDLLGVPYQNRPVVVQSELTAMRDGVRIKIPPGALLLHRYDAAEQSFYSLELVTRPSDSPAVSNAGADATHFTLESATPALSGAHSQL